MKPAFLTEFLISLTFVAVPEFIVLAMISYDSNSQSPSPVATFFMSYVELLHELRYVLVVSIPTIGAIGAFVRMKLKKKRLAQPSQ